MSVIDEAVQLTFAFTPQPSCHYFLTANSPPSSLAVIWLTNRKLPIFEPFSNLPYRYMKKGWAFLCHNIRSPSHSRVATLSRPLSAFFKIKHRHSGIFEEVIKSWCPSRALYQSYPKFHPLPLLLTPGAWYVRRGSRRVLHL